MASGAWPNDWTELLETCRVKAETEGLENQPWVCPCGRAVGNGSPSEAATRTGNSLWAHLLAKVGDEDHPGQDDMDRWEQQTSHRQNSSQKQKGEAKRKWGDLGDLWPYIAMLDREGLREVKRRIETKLAD